MHKQFTISVELVPPEGAETGGLLELLTPFADLPVDSFNIAANPIAKPRMSNVVLAVLIKKRLGIESTVHVTTRDHNRLSLQSLLWGVKALGMEQILAASGDMISPDARETVSHVRDVDVFELISMACRAGLRTGAVFTPCPGKKEFLSETERLKRKVDAGAVYAVTQPVYTEEDVERIAETGEKTGIPMVLGILPLVTLKHALFIQKKVAGIFVDPRIIKEMEKAEDPEERGIINAKELLEAAKKSLPGVCLMPPFNRFYVAERILRKNEEINVSG